MPFVRRAIIALLGLLITATALAGDAIGFSEYTNWRNWSRAPFADQIGLADSYDRTDGNDDFSQYDDPPGLIRDTSTCTVRDLAGPGYISRFWMPHLTANRGFSIRFFFDGEDTPRIDTTSNKWLSARYGYFDAPLVDTFAGGQVSYWPICFKSRLRIETVNKPLPGDDTWSPDRHYYQYNYTLLPSDTDIQSYDGTLTDNQRAAADAVEAIFTHTGDHPAGDAPDATRIDIPARDIAPLDSTILADLAGPGVIRLLNIMPATFDDADLDALRLRVRYDSDETYAIDVPLSDLFGAGHERAAFRSIPLGADPAIGLYCYWPMPFRKRAIIELASASAERTISISSAAIEVLSDAVDTRDGYFRATIAETTRADGDTLHTMLNTIGTGVYVGNLLYVNQDNYDFLMLEGDDKISVDGAPLLLGTGLEDAYNGGYYYNWVGRQFDEPEGASPRSAIRPLSGILYVNRTWPDFARADQYRWLIAERVPFDRDIAVSIECRYGVVGSKWRSVAFWYDQRPIPGDSNCDGAVNFDDIDCFVAALIGEDAWRDCGHAGGCQYISANDVNRDTAVNFDDIDAFVDCLINDGC